MSLARLATSALFFASLTALTQTPSPSAPPAPSASTPSASIQPVPTLRVTSRLVILDVVVTDANGNPVKRLDRSDFNLMEDGIPQKLASFEEHDASTAIPVAPAPALPPNTFSVQPPPPESITKTIIYIDHLAYPNYPLVRGDIADFIKTLPPGNPICIVRRDWHGLHMVQDFTTDPQILRQAVASRRMLPHLPNPDPGHIVAVGANDVERRLARYIGGIPGRINLAVVTDGGGDPLGQDPPEITTLINSLNQATTVLRLGRVAFYAIKAGGYIGGILQPLPVPELDSAFPIMPAAQGSLFANQDLGDAAAQAGGHAFFDGAAKALPQIFALGSHYYTLAYAPTNSDWDGSYRSISIGVSGIPQAGKSAFGWTAYGQSQVTYRQGYYAHSTPGPPSGPPAFSPENPIQSASETQPSPVADSSPSPLPGTANIAPTSRSLTSVSPVQAAMGFGTLPSDQIKFTITAAQSQGKEKQKAGLPMPKDNFLDAEYRNATYRNVHIRYRVDPKDLRFSQSNGFYRDDFQFIAILYGDNGIAVNSISTKAHIQIPARNFRQIMTSGVIFDQTVAVPVKPDATSQPFYYATVPDNFFLRFGVNEISTGHIGVIEIPVDAIKFLPPTAVQN